MLNKMDNPYDDFVKSRITPLVNSKIIEASVLKNIGIKDILKEIELLYFKDIPLITFEIPMIVMI